MLRILTLTFALLFLQSCGELTGESTGARDLLPGVFNNLIGGLEGIEVGSDKYLLSGVASNGGNASHNFELQFNLPQNEELSFYFFANSTLTKALSAKFKNTDSGLVVVFQLGELQHEYLLANTAGLDSFHLDLDIHNDHTDIHFLLWDHNGPHEDGDECTFEEGCLYNSEDFALDFWLGVGRAPGTFWGFKGKKKNIIKLTGPRRALSNV